MGRGGIQGYKPTGEGLDERLCTMYLSRFAFVHWLLPLLECADDPRVLSILSAGHHKVYKAWQTDFLTRRAGMAQRTYAAGFYNDCACAALARVHPKLTLIHAFPGFVHTNWYLELPWGLRQVAKVLMLAGKSLEKCGEFMAYPLLGDTFASGFHSLTEFADPCASCAGDAATEDGIWKLSVEQFETHTT